MGNRLTRIYTRTGDDGSTGLSDGARIAKDHPRIEAIGAIDELNSAIGTVLAHAPPATLDTILTEIQHTLFDLGGELSMPGTACLTGERVTRLEQWLDALNEALPPLKEFILPGGILSGGSLPSCTGHLPAGGTPPVHAFAKGSRQPGRSRLPESPLRPAVCDRPGVQPPGRQTGCLLAA